MQSYAFINTMTTNNLGESKALSQAINELKRLYLAENKEKYPSIPDHCRVKPTIEYKSANGLTKCIIDFIRLSGGQSERISSEGRVIDTRKTFQNVIGQTVTTGSIRRIKTSGQRGTADISATIKNKSGIGISVKIEVKIGSDRQSKEQQEYAESIIRAGGYYVLAPSFDVFLTWYNLTFGE